jgi:putative mRNA 3-end processing factor
MLNGGPVGHYIKNLHDREDCALILTGYQVEGTVGRTLMDTGRYKNEGINVEVKNKFKHMDFSAHTDRNHLIKFYKKLNPEKIVLVHGEQGIDDFASKLREMGFDAVAPENGQKVKIN